MVYNGNEEVHYVGIIEKGNRETGEDILLDEIEKGSMRLRVLKAKIREIYRLPGLLSVYRDNEVLKDDFAHLGDIVKPGAKLVFRYDPTVAVAGGGIANGGIALGGAFAEGGMAMGGNAFGERALGPNFGSPLGIGIGGSAYPASGVGYGPVARGEVVSLAQWPPSTVNDIDKAIQDILEPQDLTVQPTIASTNENALAGHAAPQALSVPETAEENNVDLHEEPTTGQEDGEDVVEHNRQSKLMTPPRLLDRDAGKHPETACLMSLVPPVPAELERQSDKEPMKLALPTTLVMTDSDPLEELNHPQISPRGAKSHDASGERAALSPPPVPKGFIRQLDDGRFCVKTRNRCNDVFEAIIPVSTKEEAEVFFRGVDRYDRLRGPLYKLKRRLLGLYWTFVPPSQPGPTAIASLEEGLQSLDPTEQAPPKKTFSTSTANEPDFVSHATALAAATAIAVVNRGDSTVPPQPPDALNDPHRAFICVSIGRPGKWRLRHAMFVGRANEPSHVTDEDIFTRVRAEMGKFQKSRGYHRFVFPLRLSEASYYEFTLHNPGTSAVGLIEEGRLPSEHPPPPGDWRELCPADRWYFTAPSAAERMDLRTSLAATTLTDAVLEPNKLVPNSTQYRKSVPWRLNVELGQGDDPLSYPLGWGFVLRLEFDMVVFLCIWVTVAVLLSVGLLGLYIAPSGPAHGQTGVAVAVFMAPIGFVSTWFGVACAYAKQNKYLN